jgi:hypothetical protein
MSEERTVDETEPIDSEACHYDRLGYVDRPPFRAEARVTAQGLVVDGALRFARADVVEGILRPAPTPPTVEIRERSGRYTTLTVPSIEAGRAIVRALRVDGAHRPMTFAAKGGSFVAFLAMVYAIMLTVTLFASGNGVAAGVACAVALLAAFVVGVPMKVTVGGDALLAASPWRKHSLPIASIRAVELDDWRVTVRHDRGTLTIATGNAHARRAPAKQSAAAASSRQYGALIAERIEEAMRARDAVDVGDEASLPPRGSRAATAWIADLRALHAEAGHRARPFVPDRLWRLVRSPNVEPEVRVAAAAALAPSLGPDEARDLRAVAETTVSPKVRVALEHALGEDDEALATALDGMMTRRAR